MINRRTVLTGAAVVPFAGVAGAEEVVDEYIISFNPDNFQGLSIQPPESAKHYKEEWHDLAHYVYNEARKIVDRRKTLI